MSHESLRNTVPVESPRQSRCREHASGIALKKQSFHYSNQSRFSPLAYLQSLALESRLASPELASVAGQPDQQLLKLKDECEDAVRSILSIDKRGEPITPGLLDFGTSCLAVMKSRFRIDHAMYILIAARRRRDIRSCRSAARDAMPNA